MVFPDHTHSLFGIILLESGDSRLLYFDCQSDVVRLLVFHWLFFAVPLVVLRRVFVAFPVYAHLLFVDVTPS